MLLKLLINGSVGGEVALYHLAINIFYSTRFLARHANVEHDFRTCLFARPSVKLPIGRLFINIVYISLQV